MNKKLRFSRKSALKLGTLVMAGIMTVSSVFVSTPKVIYADNAAAANVVTEIPGTVSTESSYNSSFLSITGFASVNGNITCDNTRNSDDSRMYYAYKAIPLYVY
jgi:hypothetical protein